MPGGINPSVSATATFASHMRQVYQRLASLERASSSGGGGGGGGTVTDVLWVGPSPPSDPTVELWYDTDEVASTVPTLPEADARYVNADGDTMTGSLTMSAGSVGFGSRLGQHINLYAVSYGIGVQGSTFYNRITGSSASQFVWYGGGVHSDTGGDPGAGGIEMMALSGGLAATARTLQLPGRPGSNFLLGDNVSSGPRLRMHLPVSGELTYIDFEGDTAGQGQLQFRSGTAGQLLLTPSNVRIQKLGMASAGFRVAGGVGPLVLINNGAGPYINFYDGADVDNIGARRGYIGFTTTDLYINNETGVYIRYMSGTGHLHLFFTGAGAEITRMESGGQAWGRTIGQYATVDGFDIRNDGRFISTMATVNAYNWMINIGASDVAGGIFLSLRRSTSSTQIGSITQVATTGVAYNTTSHGPWKGNVRELDDDEAMERVLLWRPVAYQWKFDADGLQSEDGEPGGDEQHGFIAQELALVQPHAVAVGFGVQSDMVPWLARKAAHELAMESDHTLAAFDEPEPFVPWGADNGKLVPDLAAAVQALIRKVKELEAR